ncbi:MAG TPA: ABC transporter permease, partial [Caulobacteraceae bacterium]|nr:ABC transporter permease [Caulobacteraceae bacterium]
RAAGEAVTEAARLERRPIRLDPGARSRIVVTRSDAGLAVRFQGRRILSREGEVLVARTLERDMALDAAGARGRRVDLDRSQGAPGLAPAGQAAARFAPVLILWLVLTGSLGMLLQAAARERANRSLESLLAAASPAEIVAGKLVGVGVLSLLVLAAWVAPAAALAPWTSRLGAAFGPARLAEIAALYLLAFAFFGLTAIGLGARARDSATAQSLARPLFAALLAGFFVAMAAAAAPSASPLLLFPPFTPFLLLAAPGGAVGWVSVAIALALLTGATVAAGALAVRGLALEPGRPRALSMAFRRRRSAAASNAESTARPAHPSPGQAAL